MIYLVGLTVVTLYFAHSFIYNLYFHPLANIPGPLFWRSSRPGFIWSMVRGNLARDIRKIHEQYGDIVRTAPDEVSFARKEAWLEIFGQPTGGALPFYKNPIFFKSPPGQPENLVTTINLQENQRMLLAFTERALRVQESVIIKYSIFLMDKLQAMATIPETVDKGADVNMNDWANFFAFDLIGDLAMGENFGCMEGSSYHPWVKMLYAYLKGDVSLFAQSLRLMKYSHGNARGNSLLPATREDPHGSHPLEHEEDSTTNELREVSRRLHDFSKMSREEVESTYQMLIIAGSETTATVLVGTISHLAQNPDKKKKKLGDEIHGKFTTSNDINVASTKDLTYLTACIEEGLRLCNPIPAGLPRCVPSTGATVCGHWLPVHTNVIVSPTDIAHNPKNFQRAAEFIPERWLPAETCPSEFLNDALDSQFPFGTGPRHCPGKLLAWSEIKIVLAKLLFQFDVNVVPDKLLVWEDLGTFIVVEKEPIYINIKPRVI